MQDDIGNAPKSLEPSELGTKEFWDKAYAREITNHGDDGTDEGTIWFDENDAEATVIRLLGELSEQGLLQKSGPQASRILDLGTGNGHMLWALRDPDDVDDEDKDEEHTWAGEMIGVDYSEASIQLATQIGLAHSQQDDQPQPQFEVWDILHDTPGSWLKDGFDLVLDKGTFDAISLMAQGASSCDKYFKQVVPLIRAGGFLVLTSCNWTKEELFAWLEHSGTSTSLRFYQQGTYPTFTFGGQTGSSIVTIAFQKLSNG